MRTRGHLPALLVLCCVSIAAPSVRDSILACTGNAPARFAWTRWPWCDAGYNPVQAYKSTANENDHSFTQLVVYSTDEGAYRLLDSTIGNHCFPRFTRKDGAYVVWSDKDSLCTWIRDFAGAAPKRKLFTYAANGSYFTLACQYNPVTDSQFVYILFDYNWQWAGTSILRAPLKADYTLDWTKKVTVVNGGGEQIDWHGSASQDGKYVGCQIPQPNSLMYEVATGTKIPRADKTQDYGCQPNVSPDNSYRFFHLDDNHTTLSMWGPGLSTTATCYYVPVSARLPYNTAGYDISNPRWSNDVGFMTVGCPHTQGLAGGGIFGMTAAQVQATGGMAAGSVYIVKFKGDFSAVESAARVSDGDIRHRDIMSDGWIGPAAISAAQRNPRASPSPGLRMLRTGLFVTLNSHSTISLSDTRGRRIRQATGPLTIDARAMNPGVYLISGVAAARPLTIAK